MSDIRIPIVPVPFGPGSQATNEDEGIDILNLPSGMDTFHPPVLPEPEDVAQLTQAKQILEDILAALRTHRVGDAAVVVDLGNTDVDDIELINQAMGEGEVSATLEGAAPMLAQESVLAGVWRVQHLDANKRLVRDTLEIADAPHFVRHGLQHHGSIDLDFEGHPAAHSNAPPLLCEIRDQAKTLSPGDDPHVINLTLLPLTEDELLLIGSRLGVGEITILSRGYGNCRIGSTLIPNVWWIKYFNSEDKLILNTIEICDVPAVALAAQEDIDDSADRLDEILELYR
ncbi:unnamed protein product [Cyprideis torosa]|uniref:Uncharacterized protein n=1 Tax=Cyprideis torosa TaxID=163714 RepID=A0A7R8X183_9CRUS|nr:unnamed protein product [Cyprideis torosa]CAG0910239.1 unnamed protein product [Cyprideis torosa]